MRLRASAALAAAATLLAAMPAMAHDHVNVPPPPPPGGYGAPAPYGWQQPGADQGAQRDSWLAECRRRLGDNGVGGAVIGGIVGGIAGHEIAGRHDRVLGTVAGAAVGAIAGAVIDKAEDRGRVRDRCDAMLDGYGAQNDAYSGYGYQGYGYQGQVYGQAYGYAPMVMMVPMMMVPAPYQAGLVQPQAAPCKETVTTREYVTYETVRRRMIPRRPVIHDKRVPITPDKRQRITPDKRVLTN